MRDDRALPGGRQLKIIICLLYNIGGKIMIEGDNICGIYAIVNKVNNKKYIGSSKSIYYRWLQNHLPMLKRNSHFNRHLQSAWNKYGEKNFEIELLEKCKEKELLEKEGFWIEKKMSWKREFGYNLTRIMDNKQVLLDETKILLSESIKNSKIENYWTTGINGEIIKLFNEGMSKNAIAIKLNITRSDVYSCLEHNGLHKNEGKGNIIKLTEEVKNKIQLMRDEDKTWEEILNETGVSKTQVYRSKVAKRDGKYGGGKNIRKSYRTLTPEVKEKAIALRSQGKSWKEIGEIFGVSRQVFYWNGIAKNQPNMVRKTMTPEMMQEAIKLRSEGKLWKEIASILGVTTNTIRSHINEKLLPKEA